MSDATSVHSNAFNFMSYWQGGVDPRTNQYTLSIDFPEFKTNYLNGPLVPLALSFNPMNLLDSGYGLGWNLQLSQFTPHDQMLSLSTGERFKVTGQDGNEQIMKERKLTTFRFYTHDGADYDYRLVHKSGLIERLKVHGSGNDRIALPVEILSPEGHKVRLGYRNFEQRHWMLEWIDDIQGRLVQVRRDTGSLTLDLHPGKGPGNGALASYVVSLDSSASKLARVITLPADAGSNISWRLDYQKIGDYFCLSQIQTPMGGREVVDYDTVGHEFPTGSGRRPVPRVSRHRVFPGGGQPDVDTHYSYDDSSSYPASNNFLGRNLSLTWTDDGLDNLYKATDRSYEYGSTEHLMSEKGEKLRSIKRTFNRFHLLTRETTRRHDKEQEVETTYHLVDGPFDSQPAYFQLPFETINRWWVVDTNRRRSEKSSTTYDSFGNPLVETQANGIVETSTYYLAAGEDGCPADPDGFVRNLKRKTTTPAPGHVAGAPTLRTDYRYTAQPPLAGSARTDWLALERETRVWQGTTDSELQRTDYSYYNAPDDPVSHGRIQRQGVVMNGKTTYTDYVYSALASARLGETVLQTLQTLSTDFDTVNKLITLESSLLNGESLLERDDNDVEIRRTYDALNRVTSETVAPDDPVYKATRRYEYSLSSNLQQRAEQRLFDVKGVKTVTTLDGLNRPIREERADADSATPTTMRQTYEASYDEFGNLIRQVEFDWWDVDWAMFKNVPLVSQFQFDDWNQQCCVIRPDGVEEHTETDPIGDGVTGPTERSWQQDAATPAKRSGVTVTQFNLFEKPVLVERIDLADKPISRQKNSYDGLGRSVKEEVGLRSPLRITEYSYDAFDRLVQNSLPLGAVVVREYAEHSAEDWPTLISVDKKTLGTQAFDGLGRMTESVTGGRVQTLKYEPQQNQPKLVTTPGGQDIGYEYRPSLCEEPRQRRLPGVTSDYEYDPQNARLLSCSETGQTLSRTYFSHGELKSETRQDEGGPERVMHYLYSLRGRLLEYTDVLGQTQEYRYDLQGRLEQTSLGSTLSRFHYDELGNVRLIETEDESAPGQKRRVSIALEYDEFNREIERHFDLDGVRQTLTQRYDDVDALLTRTLAEGSETLRAERYTYDLRRRLETYTCTGSQPPEDPYGNAIASQTFILDGLDNITLVITDTADGKSNVAEYLFNNPQDPVQLTEVINAGDAGYPPSIQLTYDPNGNLTTDEAGRILEYDALNRLLSVSAPSGGTPRRYSYDPLDSLSHQQEGSESQQRFYRDGELANTLGPQQNRTFMRGGDSLLAERQGSGTLLLAGDAANSVLSEVDPQGERRDMAYSAYGERSSGQAVSCGLGFNGELREEQNGCYLLGNGYRAYSPGLMRFHSPDNLSPFDEGGMNTYAYCEGDSINRVDPTGNLSFKILAKTISFFINRNLTAQAARLNATKGGAGTRLGAGNFFSSESMLRPTPISAPQKAVEAGNFVKSNSSATLKASNQSQLYPIKFSQSNKLPSVPKNARLHTEWSSPPTSKNHFYESIPSKPNSAQFSSVQENATRFKTSEVNDVVRKSKYLNLEEQMMSQKGVVKHGKFVPDPNVRGGARQNARAYLSSDTRGSAPKDRNRRLGP
ncbi:RHS repeat-associated core domain [Pseudomonas asplenii]|uniref:RHS repeat-associated core domain n=1 Tax=Pseudomonas asplenii TaxID=53407 RepID=A0A0M9GGV5_9PSED|nr:RHS repeat-associated core domain-containing protein [Pseudomonas fuscovaginae]KPA90697.1 RHS repeat-associated core domain [Pseudomonas fuscovaginae]